MNGTYEEARARMHALLSELIRLGRENQERLSISPDIAAEMQQYIRHLEGTIEDYEELVTKLQGVRPIRAEEVARREVLDSGQSYLPTMEMIDVLLQFIGKHINMG